MSRSPLYQAWCGLLRKCRKGSVDLCDSWHEFDSFIADVKEQPKDHCLVRIDRSRPYSAENFRWVYNEGMTPGCKVMIIPREDFHGLHQTPIYRVWGSMISRCSNQKSASYPRYGGRGIKVCDRWRRFENFLADMGFPPDGHSIERKNNDGDYCPDNCIWASRSVQAKNKSNNTLLTLNGRTQILAEWARELGVNPASILARINAGWTLEKTLTHPRPDRPNSKLTVDQVKKIRRQYPILSLQALADRYGVSKKTILNIIHNRIFRDVE